MRAHSPRRALAAAVLVPALLVPLAACGGKGDGGGPGDGESPAGSDGGKGGGSGQGAGRG
ncbi:hypothetical protein [Streptomyces axinellae]|uniref:Uncharacterized protein n=1 Tax=Streptomyces axinellae TaxID=552788 RepID=A0ABP6CGP7_9ACTN